MVDTGDLHMTGADFHMVDAVDRRTASVDLRIGNAIDPRKIVGVGTRTAASNMVPA